MLAPSKGGIGFTVAKKVEHALPESFGEGRTLSQADVAN
jgi:hypothetical protein